MRTIALSLLVLFTACGPDDLDPMELCGDGGTTPPQAPTAITSHFGADGGFRIAFVSEGFTEATLPDFRAQTERYIDGMRADPGMIVGKRPGLFTFHIISVPSASRRVKNADRSDTAFGACFVFDGFGVTRVSADVGAAARTVHDAVGDVDVVILLVDTAIGRASAGLAQYGAPQVITMNRVFVQVLDHELGHALAGLEDEYSETSAPYPTPVTISSGDLHYLFPNVSDDPTGAKWSRLASGATPGGRRYGSGVFHPPGNCRMGDSQFGFCPVCGHTVDLLLDARERGTDTDGPPRCGMFIQGHGDGNQRVLFGEAFDFTPPVRAEITMEDGTHNEATAPRLAATVMFLEREGRTRTATLRCTDGRGSKWIEKLTLNF